MFKLRFTSADGRKIELFSRPYRLFQVDGLGDVDAETQTQRAPFQDGSKFIDNILQERTISIYLKIVGKDKVELERNRKKLSSIFNPKLGEGLLEYIGADGIKQIKTVSTHIPYFPDGQGNRGPTFQKAMIHLLCPDPYWEDPIIHNYKLEDFVGNFRFPFHFPVRFATRGDGRILENNGDVPTPLLIEFRGPAERPKITNYRTGEYIRVNTTIPADHKLILNTKFGNKRVEIVKPNGTIENAFHYIDPYSTFFELDVGETRIGFEAAGGTPEVYVQYRERFVSV